MELGKAYQIMDTIGGRYYYPQEPGRHWFQVVLMMYSNFCVPIVGSGETSDQARPLKDGEVAEWILLDGVNILLQLYSKSSGSMDTNNQTSRHQLLARILRFTISITATLILW